MNIAQLYKNQTIQVTAHRGSSMNAPENTISAINLAIQEQADYVEIDVQQTKDGKLVVLHDSNLQRVAGIAQNIWELDYEEACKLDVGSWFDTKFAQERVPCLEEVIEAVKGKIKLNIELKLNGHEQELAPQVVKLVGEQRIVEQCVISSADYHALLQVKALNPQLATGLIMPTAMAQVDKLKVDFYSVQSLVATTDFINQAHALGREVHVWTINEPTEMETFLNRRIDNIITDTPETLRELLRLSLR
ncbi:MAG: glycerophosphodiester phosphodiesterase [Symploca sp. SIO1B1]|nr:glycerophosphodiester phosphodiesterase [Symploca sp. SIO1C2]NER98266.1 glycerophosphodiester phosphodiesterase [Symploca sp. SIO1B1]